MSLKCKTSIIFIIATIQINYWFVTTTYNYVDKIVYIKYCWHALVTIAQTHRDTDAVCIPGLEIVLEIVLPICLINTMIVG